MRVLAAVDKFKGTASAAQVAAAIGHACWELGHDCVEQPVADGGEGTLEALGGANRTSTVTGPLGDPVRAEWRFHRGTAVIEMARASGLTLVGGAARNDAMAATTTGTGELIDQALDLGAKKIVVCLGGSATTDGGLGCIRAVTAPHRLRGVQLLVACDVQTLFTDAAPVFGPQKGATPAQVDMLRGRLDRLAQMYREQYGVDVRNMPGTGAAGGLAGGLVALGGRLMPGFELVADEIDLHDKIAAADLVITGEGYLDEQSFEGKVIGGVQAMCRAAGRQVAAIVGDSAPEVQGRITHRSLVRDFGEERAMNEPLWCIEQAATTLVRDLAAGINGGHDPA
ncbi:MAG: glycerate kinase [Acidobacteria bacterium]|nr:glycerate kinase [Acidobacteriota bacterium]